MITHRTNCYPSNPKLDMVPLVDKVRPRWWQDTGERALLLEFLLCGLKENA